MTWTAPDTPGSYAISVQVTDGRGGEATRELTIAVLENRAPVIDSLTADPPVVVQGENTTVECVASDPDGDELHFEWMAAEGNFSGQGARVTWTAPMACEYQTVTVTVADGRGKETVRDLTIKVKKPG